MPKFNLELKLIFEIDSLNVNSARNKLERIDVAKMLRKHELARGVVYLTKEITPSIRSIK